MRHIRLAPYWLRFLVIAVLVIGVFFRFFNLDSKVYGHDEVYTSLRIAGYTTTEVKQQIFNDRILKREDFFTYQSLNPKRGLGETLKSLATEDPRHPPLYYVITRLWAQLFGTSITAIRSLSAIISLLVFPCIYWLCQELFDVPLSVPYLAIALVAISPIHLIYAQEAREHMLWLVTIILSSASLLRALRLESKWQSKEQNTITWGIYAATLSLSLYTSLLSGFVVVAHGTYVIATTEFRWTKTVKAYALFSLAAFLAFTPWLLVILANLSQFYRTTVWTTVKLPLFALIQSWLIQFSRIFCDFNLDLKNLFIYFITLIFFSLVGYSIYILCYTTHPKVWLFIVTLIAIPALPLLLPDFIFGGIRSTAEQYLMPCYLGIQLACAYLLATQLYNGILSRRRIWQMILAAIIFVGILSCTIYSQQVTWWNKVISYSNPQVANIINQSSRPLLVSDSSRMNYGNVFSLSYLVQPKVRFLLLKNNNLSKVPKGFTDIFLLNPSPTLRKSIEKKSKFIARVVYQNKYSSLWKLAKPLK
ncbi:MAG: glycosyltransferase family 39 protein [Scytonema sp. PMC 1070.18]|nr:glycosyltransferase family 39 protein [Scytonema sp. PMC 1070.18]